MSVTKVKARFEEYANASLVVEEIDDAYYAFGSELACLRLFQQYNVVTRNFATNFGFSDRMNSFYFRLNN